jgi:hypothetical protein
MTYMRVPGIDREEDRFKYEINVTNTKRADAEIDQKRAQPPMARQPDSEKEGSTLDKCLAALDALAKRMDKWEAARQAEREKEEEEREADAVGIVPAEKEREEREIKPPSESRSDSYGDFRNYPPRREYDTEEQFQLRDAQARADQVAQRFGERAPPPVTGEGLHEYRMRLLRPWQRYSAYKGANLTKIGDPKAFDAIEAQIYGDAAHASEDPDAPPGSVEGDQATGRQRSDDQHLPRPRYVDRPDEASVTQGAGFQHAACPALMAASEVSSSGSAGRLHPRPVGEMMRCGN